MTRNQFKLLGWLLFSLLSCVAGYEVPVSDKDYSRQICSGMWSSQSTFINGTVFLEAMTAAWSYSCRPQLHLNLRKVN